ncbi:MAG TPA: hypothetical protein VFI25_19230 [Planctomycetota bacterium]|nr:hypothetical protein [Planctomycetota bacterium]
MRRNPAAPPEPALARQQREDLERDRRILEAARELLLAKGYQGEAWR